jgi:alkanesulfonate monooxygenase SsuD/methylene tetrahydromethanopterin reductase-like flavin-dependent oxidoreductase (luciferase family)
LRLGIQLPEVERDVRWPEYAAMARAAEESGFDSIWLGDHLLYADGRGPWEAWTLLSALAAVTERVELGPLVACAGFHPPAVLAKMAATVDEVSAGRLILGLGAGSNRHDFKAFGLTLDRPVARFEEAFPIIRSLLAGETVTFSGRFHSVDGAVLLPRPKRRVPLMIGSNGPRMLAATLAHVDAWNTWYSDFGNTAEGFAKVLERTGVPASLTRSACVLVRAEGPAERPEDPAPVPAARLAAHVRELGEAGADEVILVASPITERSIRALGEAAGTTRRAPRP